MLSTSICTFFWITYIECKNTIIFNIHSIRKINCAIFLIFVITIRNSNTLTITIWICNQINVHILTPCWRYTIRIMWRDCSVKRCYIIKISN